MSNFIIFTLGFIFIIFGKLTFDKWFNHISLYAGIWSLSIFLFELRLINYYQIEVETWLIILYAGVTFIVGASTCSIMECSTLVKSIKLVTGFKTSNLPLEELKFLKKVLWVLNVITLLAALHTWILVIRLFGNVQNVFLFGNFLYSYRVSEGIPGSIPYVSSLSLTGVLLAGVYTAKIKKITIVALLPIIIVVMVDMASMGRAMMIIAALLFVTGYFMITPKKILSFNVSRTNYKMGVISLIIAIALLVVGGEFVRSLRRANEILPGASQSLTRLRESSFITPSIYMYLTVHHGVLNQYLKHDLEENIPAGNTLAPLFRILEKIGFDTHVETYQKSYNTPISANTGTYIRDLHADFGIFGILFGPYLIGFITSILWYRFQRNNTYVNLALLGYFIVIVGMSLFYNASRAGYLFVYLLSSIIIGYIIDRKIANLEKNEL